MGSLFLDEEDERRWVSVAPYFGSLLGMYLAGYLGIHFSFALVVFYLVWYWGRRKLALKEAHYRQAYTTRAIIVEKDKESADWFNKFLIFFWPNMNPYFSSVIFNYLKTVVSAKLLENKMMAVESIIVKKVNMGKVPFKVSCVKIVRRGKGSFSIDADISYEGDAEITLELVLGGKLLNVNCPIFVNSWVIEGRMRFTFTFASRFPFMFKIDTAFKKQPELREIAVQSINKFDVMSLSFIKEDIEDTVKNAIRDFMVLPHKYTYFFNPTPSIGEEDIYHGDPKLFDPWKEKFPLGTDKECPYASGLDLPYYEPCVIKSKAFKTHFKDPEFAKNFENTDVPFVWPRKERGKKRKIERRSHSFRFSGTTKVRHRSSEHLLSDWELTEDNQPQEEPPSVYSASSPIQVIHPDPPKPHSYSTPASSMSPLSSASPVTSMSPPTSTSPIHSLEHPCYTPPPQPHSHPQPSQTTSTTSTTSTISTHSKPKESKHEPQPIDHLKNLLPDFPKSLTKVKKKKLCFQILEYYDLPVLLEFKFIVMNNVLSVVVDNHPPPPKESSSVNSMFPNNPLVRSRSRGNSTSRKPHTIEFILNSGKEFAYLVECWDKQKDDLLGVYAGDFGHLLEGKSETIMCPLSGAHHPGKVQLSVSVSKS